MTDLHELWESNKPKGSGMPEAQRYTKKPVTIEAIQWDGTIEGGKPIHDWISREGGVSRWTNDTPQLLSIETREGVMKAYPGYFIIMGVEGEFYPCDPGIFEKTYDKEEQ